MATDLVTTTLDSGAGSLRAVLAAAAPGDTIAFAATLPGSVITLASPLTITSDVTLDGTFKTSTVTISGGNVTNILQVTSGTVTLANLELEFGGFNAASTTIPAPPTLEASAVLQTGGDLTLNHLLIKYNFFNIAANVDFGIYGQVTNGGDAATIAVTAGSLLLENSTLVSNSDTADEGAGPSGTVSGGPGGDAAPLLVTGGNVVVQSSTFSGNDAYGGRGGTGGYGATAGATGGNAAGAILVEAGTATITGSMITGNKGAGGFGGTGGGGHYGIEGPGPSYVSGGLGGFGGGVGGAGAGFSYVRTGALFEVGNTLTSNTGQGGPGGTGGRGGSGHFTRNDSSYNNGGGYGGNGGGSYGTTAGMGASGDQGTIDFAYTGILFGAGGAGGVAGHSGYTGGAGANSGGGGGGGGGGAGVGNNFALGLAPQALACFAAGTRLLTQFGEVTVESLRIGDRLATLAGRLAPIVWLGHRRLDAPPPASWPVRIAAHAFGPGRPHRDLLLSPDHALACAGALVPVRQLVNGTSIRRETVASIAYWHVELAEHAVVFAEGLGAESYLDTGNRHAFANAPRTVARHPRLPSAWDARACAPLVMGGGLVAAVRRGIG